MTTARFRDFGSGGDNAAQPLSFKIYEEEFHCYPNIQGKTLLDMVSQSMQQDTAMAVEVINTFFDKTLKPESKDAFNSLINDPERIVSVETLGEIVTWLVEQYSSRPTQGSEDSQSGQ
jgi:hypothetical protein